MRFAALVDYFFHSSNVRLCEIANPKASTKAIS